MNYWNKAQVAIFELVTHDLEQVRIRGDLKQIMMCKPKFAFSQLLGI